MAFGCAEVHKLSIKLCATAALDHLKARKVDFNQMPSNSKDTVTVESASGRQTIFFKGEDADRSAHGGPLADTWKIDSSILQCKVKDGTPIRLGRGRHLQISLQSSPAMPTRERGGHELQRKALQAYGRCLRCKGVQLKASKVPG